MLHIQVWNETQFTQCEHLEGPLEFGREARRADGPQRIVIQDRYVSRNQLRVEELPEGRVRAQNLSTRTAMTFGDRQEIEPGGLREIPLPLSLTAGRTIIQIEAAAPDSGGNEQALQTIALTQLGPGGGHPPLSSLGLSPAPETLTQWLEAVITLQRSAADPAELYDQAARAMVDLIGLDQAQVLLCQDRAWATGAYYARAGQKLARFSRTLLNRCVAERRTFYQDLRDWKQMTESLVGLSSVVVSPFFGLGDEVVGVLYGVRGQPRRADLGGVSPLEAQVVQLLAAAVGAHLTRAQLLRTRTQFEQFFSPELVRELERNPALLEGRHQEVTILVSDLRGYTALSERLGPQKMCRLVQDMMEQLSGRIIDHGGVIVDYAGDGILAMWNAPTPQPDHAARACRAALDMRAELAGLNTRWAKEAGRDLVLGIGLNTGPAQVGNTGSRRKFKYGPHGPTVNLASRVQQATKRLGPTLLITAATRGQLPGTFSVRAAGRERLAGVSAPVTLYELCGETASADQVAPENR